MVSRFLALLMVGLAAPAAQSADFVEKSSQNGPSYVLLEGEIREGDTTKLEALLLSGKINSRMIAFNSPGGSLWEGVLLGRILRYRGFSTYVRLGEECVSACLFSFMGGEQRFVYPGGKLGGHQFYGGSETSTSQRFTQYSTAELFKFAREMGVSSEVIEIASTTFSNEMHIFNDSELRQFNLSVPHKPTTFFEREALRLNITQAEYTKRWGEFLNADLSVCDNASPLAHDACVYRIMDSHGIPR